MDSVHLSSLLWIDVSSITFVKLLGVLLSTHARIDGHAFHAHVPSKQISAGLQLETVSAYSDA